MVKRILLSIVMLALIAYLIVAILIPCLLLGKLHNIYMILMLITTVWLGSLGFADDYRCV